MIRALLLFLMLTSLTLPAAWAEDRPTPDDDARAAARAGRLLVSPDAAKRAEGEALLLSRIERGGDLASFLRTVGDATASWANSEARLLEVWVERALVGTVEERDQAVRLIHALGEPAIRRLVMELRLARSGPHQREGPGRQQRLAQSDLPQAGTPKPDDTPVSRGAVPHTPAVYEIAALRDRDMNPFQIKRFLTRNADASRVAALGDTYVVFATRDGHVQLDAALVELKNSSGAPKQVHVRTVAPPVQTADEAGQNDDGARREQPAPEAAGTPAAENALQGAPLPNGPRFTIEPLVVRVPSTGPALAGYLTKWPGTTPGAVEALLTGDVQRGASIPLVGSLEDGRTWRRLAPRLPDARTVGGTSHVVGVGQVVHLFVGESHGYRRNLRREKGGGWGVESGVLRTGLDLSLRISAGDGDTLDVPVHARLSDVSRPMATTEQTPEKGAEPVELDAPEWNRQSRHLHATLPTAGGVLLLAMPDRTGSTERLALVLLTIAPTADDTEAVPQQAGAGK